MKTTRCEVWNEYVLAMLPALVAKFGGEAGAVAVAQADLLVKAREERELVTEPVADNVSESRGDLEAAHEEAMAIFRTDEASMGLRGKDVATGLRRLMTSAETYSWLEEQVREGRLWVELTREKIVAFGKATNAHVAVYHDPEVARAVLGDEFVAKVREGIVIQPDFDRAKIPGWLKTIMDERVRKKVLERRAQRAQERAEGAAAEQQTGGAS